MIFPMLSEVFRLVTMIFCKRIIRNLLDREYTYGYDSAGPPQ